MRILSPQSIVEDSESRFVSLYRTKLFGVFFLIFSILLIGIWLFFIRGIPFLFDFITLIIGIAVFLSGVYYLLYREKFLLDFLKKTYRIERGILFAEKKVTEGSFNDIESVEMKKQVLLVNNASDIWVVGIKPKSPNIELPYFPFGSEEEARRFLESLSSRMSIKAVEVIDGHRVERNPDSLDVPVIKRELPQDLESLMREIGQTRIGFFPYVKKQVVKVPHKFNYVAMIITVVMFVFEGVGIRLILIPEGGFSSILTGFVFVFAGLFFQTVGFLQLRKTDIVELSGDGLVVIKRRYTFFKRLLGVFKKEEIEDLSVEKMVGRGLSIGIGSYNQLRIKTDKCITGIGDGLSRDELLFLRKLLLYLIAN
ncbi:MAG: hypothetical protein KatS3mg078_1779 [Deltaproteobacteria bacterium]|nr:MAG: hypothetical protein KatS3mg078_1779 [Deltaproteobacteria bacterium]